MAKPQSLLSLVSVLALGFFLGGTVGPHASAQVSQTSAGPSRYQISAWAYAGNPSSPTAKHGYYVLDTVTGELWQSDTGGKSIKVSSKLP